MCRNANGSYSIAAVAGASSYLWSLSGSGWSITSGQGTTSITVYTTSLFNGGQVKVQSKNCKDHSGNRSLNVAHTIGCRLSADGKDAETIVSTEALSALNAYPNPTSGKATVTFTSDRTAKYSLRVVDMIGKVLISQDVAVVEGYNTKEINLENVAKGIYLISVQTEEGNAQTLRLIVE